MTRRGLALGLALGAALLVPEAARADEISWVTVVHPPQAGEIVREAITRLSAELRAAGFTVRSVEGTPGADGRVQVEEAALPDAPGKEARADGSFATIAILETSRGAVADVWVADHVTHKTLVRRVDVGAPAIGNAASDLAVRSVELLRASLLEVSAAQKKALPADLAQWLARPPTPPPTRPAPPAPAKPSPTREAKPPPAKATPRKRPAAAPSAPERAPAPDARTPGGPSIEAAFSVLAGGFGASPRPLLRIAYEFPFGLALRATLAPAVTSTTLRADAGNVVLRQTASWIDLAYVFHLERARLYPVLALGAGIYRLRIDGHGNLPYQGEHHDLANAVIVAGGGLGVRITPQLTASAQLDVLVITPEPSVTIVGVEQGRAGRPVFLPAIGLSATF
jgi:hypothetical protein